MNPGPPSSFAVGVVLAQLLGWIAFPRILYVQTAQPVAFSHRTHGADAGLGCEDCHAFQADGRFSGIPSVSKCAQCHAEPLGTSAEEKRLVEEFVRPGREIPWRVYAAQPPHVHFPHAQHVKRAGLPCQRCHGTQEGALRPYLSNRISGYSRDIWGASLVRVGREAGQGMKMSDCMACHARQSRGRGTACLDCHR